jgi:hypothetical protein
MHLSPRDYKNKEYHQHDHEYAVSSSALNTGIFLLKWEVKQRFNIPTVLTLLLIMLFRKFKTSKNINLVTYVNDNALITVTRVTIQLVNSLYIL